MTDDNDKNKKQNINNTQEDGYIDNKIFEEPFDFYYEIKEGVVVKYSDCYFKNIKIEYDQKDQSNMIVEELEFDCESPYKSLKK